MKKFDARRILLFCGLMLSFLHGRSQIIVFVQEPPGLVGSYDFTWADPAGGWGTPDLNIPANAITDTLAFVDEGTPADSLACDSPLVNDAVIAGKIAVIYRGSCEFGFKAFNAQNAGAVGVILINNNGAPVGMGAGALGASVTIPVVMISQGDGALLRDEILAGNVVAFIGNVAGQFANNVGIYRGDALLPKHSATPKQVCTSASEYFVSPGCWIHNNGLFDQTGVVLTGNIDVAGGGNVYNQSSAPVTIISGDSAFVTLPDFTQSSYQGYYTLTYSTATDSVEDLTGDNSWSMNFLIDSLFSYGPIDTATHLPLIGTHYMPTGLAGPFQSCIHFQDANASRLGALGLYVSTAANGADSVTGDLIEIFAYEWNDVFTGLSDPDIVVSDINTVGDGSYTYESNLEFTNVYIPFDDPVALVDDQRYLFCMSTSDITLFHGFNESLNYDENWLLYDQPTTVTDDNGTWAPGGFGADVPSSIGVRMISVEHIGMAELPGAEVIPYPNPTVDQIRIPMTGISGEARLEIMDIDGNLVASQRLSMTGGELVADVTGVASGTYLFKLTLDKGGVSSFRVVVSK